MGACKTSICAAEFSSVYGERSAMGLCCGSFEKTGDGGEFRRTATIICRSAFSRFRWRLPGRCSSGWQRNKFCLATSLVFLPTASTT